MTGRPSKDSGGKRRFESFEAEGIWPGIFLRIPFQRPFASVSGSVLVVGGGVVGCETAEFLLEQGKGVTQVTVLEMLDRMANDMSPTYRPFFLARLKKTGIKMITGARVEEISEKGVRVSRADGPAWIEGNAVVLAGGSMANRAACPGTERDRPGGSRSRRLHQPPHGQGGYGRRIPGGVEDLIILGPWLGVMCRSSFWGDVLREKGRKGEWGK